MTDPSIRVAYRHVPRSPAAWQPGFYEVFYSRRCYIETRLRFPAILRAWWAYLRCRLTHVREWRVAASFDAAGPRGRVYDVTCPVCLFATQVHCYASEPRVRVPRDGMDYLAFQAQRRQMDDGGLFLGD